MLKKFTSACIKIANNYLPNPFLFALLLTGIIFCMGIFLNNQTPLEMVNHWGGGLWNYLGFSMQMVLAVVLGNCLANTELFDKVLSKLAGIPKTPKQAVAFASLVAGIACLIQWSFGLVIGAVFAKKIAKTVKGVDYRLLIAASYSVYILTVLTSTIPLKAASNPNEIVVVTAGVLKDVVPMSLTAYNPVTLITCLIMLITSPLLNAAMHPDPDKTVCIDASLLDEDTKYVAPDRSKMTPAEKIENSRIITLLIVALSVVYIGNIIHKTGFNLTIDLMNLILFTLGMLLHKTPIAFVNAVMNAIKSATGIVIQFPFYAGIMGIMTGVNADGVSLAKILSDGIVSFATPGTFPLFSFISAALVNMFVPSAGGQWGVQAPAMFPAAQALGVRPELTVMSLCWGDNWTNLIQPFWALPALGIAKLGVRDIMGYLVVIFLWTGIILFSMFMIWGYLLV